MNNGRNAADRDAADLLYRHGVGSLLVPLLASSGLVYISEGQVPALLLHAWWVSMTAVLALRGIDILHFRKFQLSRNGRQRSFGLESG